MTHPTTGGGGTTGPGREINRRTSAEVAGSYWHATPLTAEQRTDRYAAQNGGPQLTARQRRRIGKKARHAAVRGLV